MAIGSIRVMVVDDHEPWRRFVSTTIQKQPGLEVVGEVSDGLEAVQKAEELQPDLIVLDIGLPSLDGIEAARRIRNVSPESKVLFVSQENSTHVVQGAFAAGAWGYVVKTDAGSELQQAVSAVLRGEQFVGKRFAGHDFGASHAEAFQDLQDSISRAQLRQNMEIARRHEVGFYSDDAVLLDDLTRFIEAALRAGNAAVIVATESHRDSLLLRLQARRSDIGAAIEQGRYIALDAAAALSTFMLRGMPDSVVFLELLGDLIGTGVKAAQREKARVAIFGEMCHLLWAQGNAEGAIQVEKLGNQLARTYDVDILCGYSPRSVQGGMESPIYEKICAEHSAVYSR
jgi:DNA-binding NarL/FixJ family response regulator